MKKKLLLLLVLISVTINLVNAQCLPPTNVFVSNITTNSATVSWVQNTTSTSAYNIQLFMNGTVTGNFAAQTSPFVLTGSSGAGKSSLIAFVAKKVKIIFIKIIT